MVNDMIEHKKFLGTNVTALCDIVKGCYYTLERKYHGVNHLHKVTYRVNTLAEEHNLNNEDYTSLIIATMFHDVVYIPGSKWNEEKSATLTTQILDATNNEHLDYATISRLIRYTKYDRPANDLLEQILHDADWEGFGRRWSVYEKNSRDIRAEYPNISDEDFRKGRKAFLSSIKFPVFFLPNQKDLEENAVANIKGELFLLG